MQVNSSSTGIYIQLLSLLLPHAEFSSATMARKSLLNYEDTANTEHAQEVYTH